MHGIRAHAISARLLQRLLPPVCVYRAPTPAPTPHPHPPPSLPPRRLGEEGAPVKVFALHPGVINTGLSRHMTGGGAFRLLASWMTWVPGVKTIQQVGGAGALCTAGAAQQACCRRRGWDGRGYVFVGVCRRAGAWVGWWVGLGWRRLTCCEVQTPDTQRFCFTEAVQRPPLHPAPLCGSHRGRPPPSTPPQHPSWTPTLAPTSPTALWRHPASRGRMGSWPSGCGSRLRSS